MRERVHARGGGKVWRQRVGEARVEHGVVGNKREAHDRVFVVFVAVGNHGGQGDFAARARGGGNGDNRGRCLEHAQNALHARERLVRVCDARAYGFGAVHRRAAANRDNRSALALVVELKSFFNLVNGGVGLGFVVYGVIHARVAQRRLERRGKAVFHDAAVGHD